MLVSGQGSESTYAAQARTVPTQPVRPIYATCRECAGCAKDTFNNNRYGLSGRLGLMV